MGHGQTAPQNLLDLLKSLVPKSDSAVLFGGQEAQNALADVGLPPSLDDVVRALAVLGVPLPTETSAQSVTMEKVVEAVQASPLSGPVKTALAGVLEGALPATTVAADVIRLGRPNPAPAPVESYPLPAPQPKPKPQAQTGPVPTADPGSEVSSLLIKRHATEGPQPRALGKPIVSVPPVMSGEVAPTASADPVATTGDSRVKVRVMGPPVASGQTLPTGMTEALNLASVETAAGTATVEPATIGAAVPRPQPKPTADSVDRSETPKPGLGIPDRTALGRPMPKPHAENSDDSGDGPDEHAALGRPDRVQGKVSLGRPDPHAEVGPVPTPKLKADPVATNTLDRPKGASDPAKAPTQGGKEVPVEAVDAQPAVAEKSGLLTAKAVTADGPLDNDALDPVVDPQQPREVQPTAATAVHAASASKASERAPLPKETVESVHRQIADRIETMVNTRRSGSVTVRLNPNDLGTITLTVKSIGSRVDTEIKASNEDVRLALQANRHDLVQNVESRGLTMNSFNVGQEAQPQGHGQEQRAAFVDAQRQANLRSVAGPAPNPTPTSAYRPVTTGVDYFA